MRYVMYGVGYVLMWWCLSGCIQLCVDCNVAYVLCTCCLLRSLSFFRCAASYASRSDRMVEVSFSIRVLFNRLMIVLSRLSTFVYKHWKEYKIHIERWNRNIWDDKEERHNVYVIGMEIEQAWSVGGERVIWYIAVASRTLWVALLIWVVLYLFVCVLFTALWSWNPTCPTSIPFVLCKLLHIVYTTRTPPSIIPCT